MGKGKKRKADRKKRETVSYNEKGKGKNRREFF